MTPFTHLGPMFNFPSPPANSAAAINNDHSSGSNPALSPPFSMMAFGHPLRSTFSLQPFGSPVNLSAPSMPDVTVLPVLQAQTTLLQAHMDMLEAELRQVRALYEKQLALQESMMNAEPVVPSSVASSDAVEQKQA
jgi:hypothetical protein